MAGHWKSRNSSDYQGLHFELAEKDLKSRPEKIGIRDSTWKVSFYMNINNESILSESEGKLLHFGNAWRDENRHSKRPCRPHLFKKLTLQWIFLENRIVMHNKSRREKEQSSLEFRSKTMRQSQSHLSSGLMGCTLMQEMVLGTGDFFWG